LLISQILIDGKDRGAVDNDGNVLPTLVYMAREKRPQYHHNFKAGAMNALVHSLIFINPSPITLQICVNSALDISLYLRDKIVEIQILIFIIVAKRSGPAIIYI
jgi:hypothetical protein